MKPPRLPPLIARRLREFEESVRLNAMQMEYMTMVARRRRTLTLAIRKAIAAGK